MRYKTLQQLMKVKFNGSHILMANEMVRLFCEEYGISGSANGHDLYEHIQKAILAAVKEEKEVRKAWMSY